MSLHLFKFPMSNADMFIREVNLQNNTITYQIYDKEGKPMEPLKTEKLMFHKDSVFFDKNRELPVQLLQIIHQRLH